MAHTTTHRAALDVRKSAAYTSWLNGKILAMQHSGSKAEIVLS